MIHTIRTLALVAACASIVSAQTQALGKGRFEAVEPTAQIPRDYRSWSLFLICNPAWIVQNGETGIPELYRQYKAFGDAIGPRNLAIWFWKQSANAPSADLTDVSRSSQYCEKYKLLPSESPFVLITTQYPDEANVGDRYIVKLGGLDAKESALALAKLTDQILVTGLNQKDLDARDRWQRMLVATRNAVSMAGCYFNKVSFSLKTRVLAVEIAHTKENKGPSNGC